jgi:hypothetical protein
MSRNGSGTYTLPAGNPVVTGTTISTTWANNTLNDIAATLTDSVAADGQTPMTGDLDLNSNKIVNLAAGTIAGDAVEYSQFVAATSTAVAITGGTINGTTIGETTRSSGKFTTLQANGATTLTSTLAVTGAATLSSTLGVTGIATFSANSAFNGTGALKIPAGTTGEQPSPVAGMIRYNSTTTLFEGYGTSWASLGGGAAGSNTQIQYNNSGVLAGSANLTFDGTTATASALSVTNNLSFNSGYGSSAVAYGCRAWVNFNGTGTVAIRESGNVSSITDNNTGDYTVNFTSAMPDANYSALVTIGVTGNASGTNPEFYGKASNFLTGSVGANSRSATGGTSDSEVICVAILR